MTGQWRLDFCVDILKVVGDSEIVSRIINSGRLFRPLKFNNLYSLKNIEVYKNNFYPHLIKIRTWT